MASIPSTAPRPAAVRRVMKPAPGAFTVPRPDLAAAIPDLTIGLVYLIAWVAPRLLRADLVAALIIALILEFLVIHSSAFLGAVIVGTGSRRSRAWAVFGISLFYLLMTSGFSWAMHSWAPLVGFCGLTANRLSGVMFGQAPAGRERDYIRRAWVVSLVCFIGFTFLTIKTPIPRLGLTADLVASLPRLHMKGAWVAEPWRAMAFGFLYFTSVGPFELKHGRPARV